MNILTAIYQFLLWISSPLQNLPYTLLLVSFTIINIALFTVLLLVTNHNGKTSERRLSSRRLSIFMMWLLIVVLVGIEWYMLVGVLGVVVGEENPDAYTILINGHWVKSLKNHYYDLIDVHAFYMVLFTLWGSLSLESVLSDLPLSMAISIFLALTLRVLSRRLLGLDSTLLFFILFLALAAVPVITLYSWNLAAPITLSTLAVYFVIHRQDPTKWFIFVLLYVGALLYHGSSMLILLLLLAYFFTVRERLTIFSVFIATIITFIVDILRFLYTTAYLGAGTYWNELLGFLRYGLQVATREPRWSAPQIPRVTSYSFTILPALAASLILYYFIMKILKKKISVNTQYLVHLLAGAAMLLMGMAASTFSNSLSRELGYPGFIVIAVAATYTLKQLEGKNVRIFLLAITIVAYVLFLFTPNNRLLYAGLNTIPSYTPTTCESYIMAEMIASYYGTGNLYIQSSYAVPIGYVAFKHGISIIQTSSPLGSLVFSSSVGDVWWS